MRGRNANTQKSCAALSEFLSFGFAKSLRAVAPSRDIPPFPSRTAMPRSACPVPLRQCPAGARQRLGKLRQTVWNQRKRIGRVRRRLRNLRQRVSGVRHEGSDLRQTGPGVRQPPWNLRREFWNPRQRLPLSRCGTIGVLNPNAEGEQLRRPEENMQDETGGNSQRQESSTGTAHTDLSLFVSLVSSWFNLSYRS